MYGNNIIPTGERALYDIPAYIRKGVRFEPNPTSPIVYILEPEKPATEPVTPPNVDIPPVVPKPEKNDGEEDTTKPPKKRKSTISLKTPAILGGRFNDMIRNLDKKGFNRNSNGR